MKTNLCLTVLVSLGILSAPIYASTLPQLLSQDLVERDLYEVEQAQDVCSRDLDDKITDLSNAGISGQAIAVYTVGSGGATLSACRLVQIARSKDPNTGCPELGVLIASVTALIYNIVQSKSTGTQNTREEHSLAALISKQFQLDGMQYENISPMAILKRDFASVNTKGAIFMQERVSIKGLHYADELVDMIITTFSDDTGHVFVTPTPGNSTSLTKRHDGPGFKTNYRQISFASNGLGTPNLHGMNIDLANSIASNWAVRANNDKINEFILTTGITRPKLETIGIRIIGETRGYGEEYGSVDSCGTLRASHDELRI